VTRATKHNAAENRNHAIQFLTTDVVSFFDADDVMHPQRLQAIDESSPFDILLHSYVESTDVVPVYDTIPRVRNQLARSPTGCAVLWIDYTAPIHHAHVTVARPVLDRVQFREGPDGYKKEDALFCGDVLAIPDCRSVYIPVPLSIYFQTGYTIDDEYLTK
jgi:glycosyltransferase involved in cell wall biosynthesis